MSVNSSDLYNRFKFQNDLIYKNQPTAIILMFGVIALLVVSFHGVVPSPDLYFWTTLCVTSYGARYFLVRYYLTSTATEQSLPLWERRFYTSVIVSGLIWGSSAFIIYPPTQLYQVILLFIVSLLGVATAATHSGYRFASGLFIVCSMLPFIIRLVIEPGLLHSTIASWLLLFSLLLIASAKNLHRATITVFDLTREKNHLLEQVNLRNVQLSSLNEKLIEANDYAQAAARAKSQFLANMSHEIRTPMHGVLGMAQVLEGTRLDDHQRHYLDTLERSGETLLSLLDDILELAKIESRGVTLSPENVNLRRWIEDLHVLLLPLFNGSDVALRFQVKDELPDSLLVDRTRLTQIVVNLVGNAAKFTKHGHVILSINGDFVGNNTFKLALKVIDTGVGIPAEQLNMIFNSFYQLNQDRVYDKGAGLGLAISQQIAEAMGTTLWVDSAVGKGSCFGIDILLPVAVSKTDDEHKATVTDLPALKLLVVDDDPISRKLVSLLLKQKGHSVSIATNGKEGIEMAKRGNYDAILMDVHMPVMDGEEAVHTIRTDSDPKVRQTPIIGITASVMGDEKERYIEAGMSDVVAKPIVFNKLSQALRNAINVQLNSK